jgi:hypothetical protein
MAGWRSGDRSLANCRVQCDPGGAEFVVRMPGDPSARCPVAHDTSERAAGRIIDLGAPIAAVTVAMLATGALTHAGDDAAFVLGRRGVPLGGLYCGSCGTIAPTAPLLLPAARAAWRACACGAPPRPLGQRTTIAVRELLGGDVAALTLAAWGAGHGDEFVAVGSHGCLRLRCTFDWEDIDAA